ncbi:MAG: hypothetical protein VR65_06725 [Desulfobulbaceae bacterium BRH_c16a]|nr:MAG: hypothetical protein VR65_06725 [Desulfobulbaceae bacterium BRH_c16a]
MIGHVLRVCLVPDSLFLFLTFGSLQYCPAKVEKLLFALAGPFPCLTDRYPCYSFFHSISLAVFPLET